MRKKLIAKNPERALGNFAFDIPTRHLEYECELEKEKEILEHSTSECVED
jgi:hypothetical protein